MRLARKILKIFLALRWKAGYGLSMTENAEVKAEEPRKAAFGTRLSLLLRAQDLNPFNLVLKDQNGNSLQSSDGVAGRKGTEG